MTTDFAAEMLSLSRGELDSLNGPTGFTAEVLATSRIKGGARKRQIKHLAGLLRRDTELEARLLELLSRRRGSAAKEKKVFHELELMRDQIITDALAMKDEADEEETRFQYQATDGVMPEIAARMPELDPTAVARAAETYCFTRRKGPLREIFRLLKSAAEAAEVAEKLESAGSQQPHPEDG